MKLLNALGAAFLDHKGEVSAMRITTILVCFIILGVWVTFMFIEGRYIPLGWAEAGLIGAAVSAKAVQSRFELGQPSFDNSPAEHFSEDKEC